MYKLSSDLREDCTKNCIDYLILAQNSYILLFLFTFYFNLFYSSHLALSLASFLFFNSFSLI